jgi:murein DD-endopeptidase MepM/ murein hydrolase activator NlpD
MLATSRTAFVYPVMGPRMSSDFGVRRHPIKKIRRHHDGIDLAAPIGAPIRSIMDGQVMYADPHGGYGKYIVVRHVNGFTSHYGHCDTMDVAPGAKVAAGQILGTVGSSGVSTGPHLHFEIRRDGDAQDPEKYLPGLADEAAG